MGVIRRRLRQLFHHQQQQGALSFATVTAFLAFLLLSSVSALRLHPTRQLSKCTPLLNQNKKKKTLL